MGVLGDWPEAHRQAEEIIRLRPPGRARSRAFGQLALAKALVVQGSPDEACPIAQDVLDSTQSLASFLVIEQLLDLQQLFRRYRANKAVAEFLAVLDESLRQRLWLYQWLTKNGRDFACPQESP